MKKFLICCLFGSTANSLAKKMQLLAEKKGHPLIVSAVDPRNLASVVPVLDGFLTAPHIQYEVAEIRGIVGDARSITVVESLSYASLDVEKVLAFVMVQVPELAI